MPSPRSLSFRSTVRLLLATARLRALARSGRQRELWNNKAGKGRTDWGCLGPVLMVLLMVFIHGFMAYSMGKLVEKAQIVDAERDGKLVVPDYRFKDLDENNAHYEERRSEIRVLDQEIAEIRGRLGLMGPDEGRALSLEDSSGDSPAGRAELQRQLEVKIMRRQSMEESLAKRLVSDMDRWIVGTAFRYSRDHGGKEEEALAMVREKWERSGRDGFVPEEKILGKSLIASAGPLTLLAALVMLGWWMVMMACQGEGMELDFQRRRHPMWEWLLGHPVAPGAVFLAEMLAPLAANPMYWTAPLFWGIVFWNLHDFGTGGAAMLGIGIPVTVALACLGKALEVWAMLRLSMRSRGAVLGILSWLGYASMVGVFFLPQMKSAALTALRLLEPLADGASWSWGRALLGFDQAGQPAFWQAMMIYPLLSAFLAAGAVVFSVWATRKGLAGGFGGDPVPAGPWLETGVSSLGGDPLFKKELLWFKRDRGAVIQVILIPVTMAAFQLFQLRAALEHVTDAWYLMCGAAVVFGTYFLFILGPRSLVSEGAALWLAWTWPRGMEDLLKAKAKLWWMLSSAIVGIVLLTAGVLFPQDWWRISLVGVGWYYFSYSLAQKTVTLVGKPSESGESEPVPRGRRWAASLGTFSFAVGILTQQWSLAFTGVVYSWITAAAMWQNFRARLPFLYDPWSEKLPPPPTLMHALVAISAMLEVMAVMTVAFTAWLGSDKMQAAQAICYAVTGLITFTYMTRWLEDRGVDRTEVWTWGGGESGNAVFWAGGAVVAGLLLAGMAQIYTAVLMWFPDLSGSLVEMRQHLEAHPAQRWWLLFTSVICAPLAEEYLFRGLLFRALDREWGGWSAVLASAGFFAILHPVVAWLPVAAVGVACALLFKSSRRLWPCVFLHAAYNAVVVYWA